MLPVFAHTQDIPKGANLIKVSGVTFRDAAMSLLDAGFSFEKVDSNFQTLKTEWKDIKGYSPKIKFEIRVKDSTLIIKGSWQNMNILFDIENQKWAAYRVTFSEMNNYALSFRKPVEYLSK